MNWILENWQTMTWPKVLAIVIALALAGVAGRVLQRP